MKLIFAADIHASSDHLFSLLAESETAKVDALVIGGDLVPHHLPGADRLGMIQVQRTYLEETLIPAVKRFREKRDIPVYLDLGNDDLAAGRKVLETVDGKVVHLLHLRRHRLTGGIDLVGYMNVPPTPFQRKDWEKPDTTDLPHPRGGRVRLDGYITRTGRVEKISLDPESGDTIEKDLLELEGKIESPFIFVAHSPPFGTPLDVLRNGVHVGSLAIRNFIEKWSRKGLLIASLHGHVHEAPLCSGTVHTEMGPALCVNPGQRTDALRYVILGVEERPHKVRILQVSG